MLTRRTLASLTVIAALAGGAAGSVTSSVTNPQQASAQVPAPADGVYKIKSIGKAPPNTLEGIGKLVQPMSYAVSRIDKETDSLPALAEAVGRIEAKINELDAKIQDVNENVAGVGRLVRTPSGRTLGNVVETIEYQTK